MIPAAFARLSVIYFRRGRGSRRSGRSNPWKPACLGKSPRGSARLFLDTRAPPSELLEICELSQEKMSSVFEDSNVYMLHMMYQAMGVCLYMQDWEGALRYGQKIIKPYR